MKKIMFYTQKRPLSVSNINLPRRNKSNFLRNVSVIELP